MPQLLKRGLEFFKNYFLSQFMSFTRKSVLLLYNYTLFFFWSCIIQLDHPPDLPLLALNWLGCFQNSNAFSKDEDWPLLKMCLRLWRQFPKRSPEMCAAPYPLPASKFRSSSFSKTSWGPCFCQAPSHHLWCSKAPWKGCFYLAPLRFHVPSPLNWLQPALALITPTKQLMRYSKDKEKNLMTKCSDLCSRAQGSSPLIGTCHQLCLFFFFNSSNFFSAAHSPPSPKKLPLFKRWSSSQSITGPLSFSDCRLTRYIHSLCGFNYYFMHLNRYLQPRLLSWVPGSFCFLPPGHLLLVILGT